MVLRCIGLLIETEWIVDQATSLSVEPSDATASSVGDVVVFSCQLDGVPTPHTRWYRDTQLIAAAGDDGHYVIHNDNGLSVLEVHTMADDDAGLFRCEVSNGVEQPVISRSARLSFNATSSHTNRCMYSCCLLVV